MEYNYFEIRYRSCEGNSRWLIARTPDDWDEEELRSNLQLGGCGDDIASINSINQVFNVTDYSYDFVVDNPEEDRWTDEFI